MAIHECQKGVGGKFLRVCDRRISCMVEIASKTEGFSSRSPLYVNKLPVAGCNAGMQSSTLCLLNSTCLGVVGQLIMLSSRRHSRPSGGALRRTRIASQVSSPWKPGQCRGCIHAGVPFRVLIEGIAIPVVFAAGPYRVWWGLRGPEVSMPLARRP